MDEECFQLWKRRARSYQQSCCNSLGDRVYDRVNYKVLASKVGYALYNAPSESDEKNKTADYTKAQKNHIKLICDKIKLLQPSEEDTFYISYFYVVIRLRNKKQNEGVQVLFRVPKIVDGKLDLTSHEFLDPKPRKYESWANYLKKNKLPKCDMCYPVDGVYTAIDGSVDLNFGKSPACDTSTAVFTGLDVSSTVLLVGATGVTLASLAVPIAAPVIWGAAATVFASGTYETARTVYRLHDIKKHGESLGLKNPESRSAWLSLAGSVVGMASIGTTAIAKGVIATESAISRTGIMTLRILNVSSLAISGIGVINGITTLVMKFINGTLKSADILNFTSACLFFSNALVTYSLASRLIEELAFSDLTNLFNLRENTSYRIAKDILEFNDSTTYNVLRQLVLGVKSYFSPDISFDDLESVTLTVVALNAKRSAGTISLTTFIMEIIPLFQKVWQRYENVIMKVIEEIKNTFEIPYWQQVLPNQACTNLEVPRQMCEEIRRAVEICGISSGSQEQKNLMAFARAFSATRDSSSFQEIINRFKFYCDCIIAQFREEREKYENKLDSKISDQDFERLIFDHNYGISGDKNVFFFVKALDEVNHPDFLDNIDELYDKLPRTEETNTKIPYLQTEKGSIYTFCGPSNEKELPDSYYWTKVVDLTGFTVDSVNSKMDKKNNLVVIEPNNKVDESEPDNKLGKLEAILVYSTFTDNCHMGLMLVILK